MTQGSDTHKKGLALPTVEQERIRSSGHAADDGDAIDKAHARMLGAKGAMGGEEKESNQEEGGQKTVTGS